LIEELSAPDIDDRLLALELDAAEEIVKNFGEWLRLPRDFEASVVITQAGA